jgi:hypothetical protein
VALHLAALEGEAVLLNKALDRGVCDVFGAEPATFLVKRGRLRQQLPHGATMTQSFANDQADFCFCRILCPPLQEFSSAALEVHPLSPHLLNVRPNFTGAWFMHLRGA